MCTAVTACQPVGNVQKRIAKEQQTVPRFSIELWGNVADGRHYKKSARFTKYCTMMDHK